jgi:hypothetical protein
LKTAAKNNTTDATNLATPHLPTLANRRTWHLAAVLTAAVSFFEPPPLAVFSVVCINL